MRRSHLLVLSASLLLPSSLRSQAGAPVQVEVGGRVVDAVTQAPVAGAVVELRDVGRKAVSDSTGWFVLQRVPRGTHEWRISRIGYAAWEESTEVDEGDEFTIALLARPEVLEGITAIASQLTHRREAAGVAVRTVDSNTLRLAGSPSAFEVVHDRLGVAGVQCPNVNTGTHSCAWVRGELMPVMVYVDEQRMPGGLEDLRNYVPQELFTVESYDGGRMIRVITVWFAERLARGRTHLMPLSF
ncbi:MAG TPA: carboxypeptidase regulatory-like domain-containing protein [Longimicrobium sp.]|nr:carboxypeptidase regulatory-like domain-containing protein [Longimicrobium sp.]